MIEETKHKDTLNGVLQEDWKAVRLGEVAETRKETVDPRNGKYRYVGLEHIDPGVPQLKRFGCSDEVRSAKSKFYFGDILYGKLRPYLDKCVLVDFEGISSTDIIVIKMDNNVSNKFLSYFLHTDDFREYATKTMTGVNHPRTSWRALSQFSISLPPLPEQHRIAAVLSAAQDAKEKTGAVIAAAKSLKKSLMHHLFTYGPVSIGAAESVPLVETEIGLVPEGWEAKTLVDIATLQRGKDLPKQNQIPGPYPIVGSSGVIGYHDKHVCVGPGVITGRSGSIGKLTYIEKDYWPHNTCLYVKDFHTNNPKFIYYLLHSLDFKKYAAGVSVPTLNRNSIHSALLPLPPLPTQKKIASILSTVDKKIEAEENKKKAIDELFKSLLHNLMTGKIRVNHLEAIS